jgi:hypothetical protein
MKRFVLNLVVGLALLAGVAQAQESPTLSSLDISLWPEFDRPEMLVIYRGLFAADTSLPVPVEFRIPASAGEPTAVAYVGEGGQRLNQPHTTRLEDDWLVVSFELPSLGFQLEYYAALAVDSADQREFAFNYTADYATTELSLDAQVPLGAQGFAIDPPAAAAAQEADGLTYHRISAGPLAQGESQSWTITYQKSGSALTAESLAQASVPDEAIPPPAETADNSNVVIFVIAFVALIAVGGAAFWLGRQTQPAPEPLPQASRKRKRRGSGKGEKPPEGGTSFCHQCGAVLRYDSEFCHKCGTAIRKP